MIEVKYGCVWGGWCTGPVSGPYDVGLWKNISQGLPSFSHYILFEIGDGSRVKFWQDCRYGESPFAVCFPKLFRFFRDKEASVAELMKFSNGILFWDVTCEFL